MSNKNERPHDIRRVNLTADVTAKIAIARNVVMVNNVTPNSSPVARGLSRRGRLAACLVGFNRCVGRPLWLDLSLPLTYCVTSKRVALSARDLGVDPGLESLPRWPRRRSGVARGPWSRPTPGKDRMIGNGGPINGSLIHIISQHSGYKDACERLTFPVLPFRKEMCHNIIQIGFRQLGMLHVCRWLQFNSFYLLHFFSIFLFLCVFAPPHRNFCTLSSLFSSTV